MRSLVSALGRTGPVLKTQRRPLARLLGLAPAAPTLSGLFTVWAGPLATPAAADRPPTPRGRAREKLLLSLTLASLLTLALGGATSAQPLTLGSATRAAPADQTTPTVSAIDPAAAANDIDTAVTISGAGLAATPTASLGTTILTHVTWVNSTTLTATVPWGMNPGVYTLTVVNPDGGTATLAGAFTVTQGIGQWNGGDLFGGSVTQILMKPGDPNTLYAPAAGIAGLFRSGDAGELWTYVSAEVAAGAFAVDPHNPTWLYGFDYNGLHRSEDEGDTWTRLMPNAWPDGRRPVSPQVYVSPYDPAVLFISASEGYGDPTATGAYGLIKSSDGGASWHIVADMEGILAQSIAFHPTDPSQMVLATSDGHVYQSTNAGDTWSEVTKPPISSLGSGGLITYNSYTPTEVWIASAAPSGGIYESTAPTFSSWQDVTPSDGAVGSYGSITFTGADSVYTTRHHSTDGGLTWQLFGPMTSYGELTFNPTDPQIAYIGDDTYGVQKTTDGGQTWEIKSQGLAGMRCLSLEVSRADPLRVFATFEHWPGIYRSDDGATNWTYLPIAGSGNVRWVREDPFDPQRLYVAADSGFYVSTDVGETWSDLGWNLPPSSPAGMSWAMAPDPNHAGHLLVGLVSGSYGIGTGRLYSSGDYGVSWQQVIMPQDVAWINSIAFDPTTPGLVYLTTGGTGVYRSTDSGAHWQRIDDLQPDMQYVGSIVIATHPQHMVLAGTSPNPYRSLDGGATWDKAQVIPSGGSDFMFADGDSNRLYFGSVTGLFLSSDVGDSWTPATGVLGTLQIMALGYADADGHTILYAATVGGAAGATSSTAATSHAVPSATSGLVDAGIYRYVLSTTLALSGIPSPSVAGVAYQVTVTARDAYANTATGYRGKVHFASSDTKAVLPADYTFTASDAGVHTFNVTLKTVGTQSVTATDTVTASIKGSQSGIVVRSVPGTPRNVTAAPADASAIVSWAAPTSNGGSPITGYTVTSSPGSKTCTTTGTLSCTATGLTNGQAYTFIVKAKNAVGWGPASAASNSVTPRLVPSTYHPITPVRLLDTRSGNGLSGKLVANTPRTFQITGRLGIPAGASAVTGNVTVVGSSASWAVYLGPTAISNPTTSTINFAAGQVIGNGLIVALSSTGTLSATYMGPTGATTDLVFDVTGFYTPDASGETYHPINPVRELDTRYGNGLSAKLKANTPACFSVAGRNGVPTSAKAVSGNVTVVNPSASWAVYLGPLSTSSPTTSAVNFGASQVAGNNLTTALNTSGQLCATYMGPAGATTDLVFDVTGYYTADLSGASFVAISPARVLDTRTGSGPTGKISANTPRTFSVAGVGGVPSGALGVTGNVTVVNETAGWAVFLGPTANPAPTTSTINFSFGDVKGNGLTVALSGTGTLSATYISSAGNKTDLVFDVTGYFIH